MNARLRDVLLGALVILVVAGGFWLGMMDFVPTSDNRPAKTTPAADPRAELSSAIADAIHNLESKNYIAFVEKSFSPNIIQQSGRTPVQLAGEIKADPQVQQRLVDMVALLRRIQQQTPDYPDANHAVYQLNPPVLGQPSVTFEKENGLWYLAN